MGLSDVGAEKRAPVCMNPLITLLTLLTNPLIPLITLLITLETHKRPDLTRRGPISQISQKTQSSHYPPKPNTLTTMVSWAP